jgi:MarR family transcriptional regulator, negative regulator of the multidrug operon emrRAB
MRHKSIQKVSPQQHIHPTADQAMEPYLRQMRKVARRGADFDATSLGLLLLFLADDVTRSVATRLQPYGISEKKLDVLLLFTAKESTTEPLEPPTPTSIADYMNVTQSSATGLLDWLETRGLIGRKSHPTDRRSIQTEITPKGRELVAQVLPTFCSACEELAIGLTDRDRTDLKRVLSKVWNHIKGVEVR